MAYTIIPIENEIGKGIIWYTFFFSLNPIFIFNFELLFNFQWPPKKKSEIQYFPYLNES